MTFMACTQAWSQSASVLPVTVTTSASKPFITLKWPLPSGASTATAPVLWRRTKGSTSWGTSTALGMGATSYADTSASAGVVYEYSIKYVAASLAYGSVVAGYNVPMVESRGKVILLVDATMAVPLAPELARLEADLAADGWVVYRHDVARQSISSSSTRPADYPVRLAELQAVRTLVRNDYNTAPGSDWALLIVGHIPVVYSGLEAPDGHADHFGAWSTDVYYADVDGTWTDSVVDNSSVTLQDIRTRNVPGDGKFDQSFLPSNVELQCGRVDMWGMSSVPVGVSEVQLLRQYLQRNHAFRYGLAPYDRVVRRGIVDDNFGGSYSPADWRAGIGFFGLGPGLMEAADWFGTVQTNPVLLGVGHGPGSSVSCDGVGTSFNHFGMKDSLAVFTMMFGSYFGDWDSGNNFLRAPLAGTANSLGLADVWSGRGYFHLYHMAMGEVIGYGVRYTQNNSETSSTGGWDTSFYPRAITYNLMGDPTLRLHSVRAPSHVVATASPGGVTLTWDASPDASLGYHVYRATAAGGPFTRLTGSATSDVNPAGSPIAGLTYTDTSAVSGTTYTYLVKAVKMEVSASGTYVNQSLSDAVTIAHQSGGSAIPAMPTGLAVLGVGSGSYALTWQDNAVSETSYEVERRDYLSGSWTVIASLPANSTSYTDTGAPLGQATHYRVRAVASGSNSLYSQMVADLTFPGIVRTSAQRVIVNKGAGNVNLGVERFNGSLGSVSATVAISSLFGPSLVNGDFEIWGETAGTPPTGVPSGWTVAGSAPVQAPGLVSGSTYSAFVTASVSNLVYQVLAAPVSQGTIDFVLAATDPGSSANRSFHLILYANNPSDVVTPLIVLRTVRGSAAGKLSLQAYNGSWQTIAADALLASVYDAPSNSFTTLKAYNFRVTFDWLTASYSVSYGTVGSALTTLANVNMFQNVPSTANGQKLTRLDFSGNVSSNGFAVDAAAVASKITPPATNTAFVNGDLESWGSLSGVPPTGTPSGWVVTGVAPTQAPGLVTGSTCSALVTPGAANILAQNLAPAISRFTLEYIVAATDPGSDTSRSFHSRLFSGTNALITLRMVRGSVAGKLSLQAYNGAGWQTLAADAFDASVYVPASNSFSTLNAYTIRLAVDFLTDNYSLSYGRVGGALTTLPNVNLFQTTPNATNGETLTQCDFCGMLSASAYAVDNIVITPVLTSSLYPTTLTTLNWSHNQTASQSATVNVVNPSGPQLTEILKMAPVTVRQGMVFGSPASTYLMIRDVSATLPSPWSTITMGDNVLYGGYGEYANGTFGMAIRSSFLASTSDSMRFLYQSVTGDFQLTARLAYLSTGVVPASRAGVMVRASGAKDAVMESLTMTGASIVHSNRSTAGAYASSTSLSGVSFPYWLRLARAGNALSVYRSTDGSTWTQVDSAVTLGDLGTTAFVGFALTSSNANAWEADNAAYARFDNVSVYTVPGTPVWVSVVDGVLSGQIQLSWLDSVGATSYIVERSTTSGSGFAPIATTTSASYLDSGLVAGQIYYYRIKAINPAFQSAYSSVASHLPYLPVSIAGWRYQYFGSDADAGSSADLADPDHDGVPNLLEYALGRSPSQADSAVPFTAQVQNVGGQDYLTVTFVRAMAATDVQYTVEMANQLNGTWSSVDALATENQVLVQDNTPSVGLQTVTVKDSQPYGTSFSRFVRLRISWNN